MKTNGIVALGLVLLVAAAPAALAGDQKKELAKREKLLAALEDARAKALAAIFDTKTYKDADHGRSGQKDVDALVEVVRSAYGPVRELLDGDAQRVAKLSAERRAAFLDARDADLCTWERAVRRHVKDRETLAKNGAADADAEQVRLTNEYRMLMGRPALALDARLATAAKGHSKEMRRLRYFSHTSPTDGERSHQDRIAKQGITGVATGENIASGYGSAKAAFDGWYRSAGHHRNMLAADWTRMGAGAEGDLWTQNYAG